MILEKESILFAGSMMRLRRADKMVDFCVFWDFAGFGNRCNSGVIQEELCLWISCKEVRDKGGNIGDRVEHAMATHRDTDFHHLGVRLDLGINQNGVFSIRWIGATQGCTCIGEGGGTAAIGGRN